MLVQFRYGTFYAMISAIFLSIVFFLLSDSFSILSNLEGLSGDEGSGQLAQVMRQFTFGYEFVPVIAKIALLSSSILFQPILAIIKFYAGSPFFVLFLSKSVVEFGRVV